MGGGRKNQIKEKGKRHNADEEKIDILESIGGRVKITQNKEGCYQAGEGREPAGERKRFPSAKEPGTIAGRSSSVKDQDGGVLGEKGQRF